MAEITLGVNNGFALKNWPEPAAWAEIIARDLGLQHVQLSFDLLDPTVPEPGRSQLCDEVLAAARRHGLQVDTTFTGLIAYAQNMLAHPAAAVRAHARRYFHDALKVTALLQARASGGHVGAMSLADYADPERRAATRGAVIETVRQLSQVAAALGQQYFLWELMPLASELPSTPEEARQVLEEANAAAGAPVLLCFDLGHCRPGPQGEIVDPHRWLEALLPWTPVVHLQQTDGLADRHWPFSPQYAGAGIVDPRRVVEIARSSPRERVDLVLELGHAFDAPPQQIIDEHKWSVAAFARWL